ncbi:HAD family phosphatase [Cellulomonas sp. ATA003]|uniref:HAD family hydrolase n=1 Tax=Cellulomonas sp. ATA003 TaxID=3073064 RepID=UPI002872AFB4|nr:HAD family phosphatase [Cellulomonas sp. ATA003]WNB86843.1 HAD family phosphatase [Cellulomonas sp. ATA003]
MTTLELTVTVRPTHGAAGEGADRALPLPEAVLWDMDGTLVNTEPYWMAAETELVEAHGGTWSHEQGLAMVGQPLEVSARILRDHGVDLPAEEIVDFLIGRVVDEVGRHVPWQPGARELLLALAEAEVPCALVTMSYRRLADPFVAAAPPGVFRAVVVGDEVTHGKPHPEAYLTAAAQLGVDPTRCVAVEDSPSGIGSALASGARTIGVEVMLPIAPAPGLSRVGSLADLTLDDLARVAGGDVLDLMAPTA